MTTPPPLAVYGYFTEPWQDKATYDPGTDVPCPICGAWVSRLYNLVKTISLILEGDNRSYFYRTHQVCYDRLTDEQKRDLDSVLIDAVAKSKETN